MPLHPEIEKSIKSLAWQRAPDKYRYDEVRVDQDDIDEFASAVSYRGVSYDADTDEAVIEIKALSDFLFRVNPGNPIQKGGKRGEEMGKDFGEGFGDVVGESAGGITGVVGAVGVNVLVAPVVDPEDAFDVGSAIGDQFGGFFGRKLFGAVGKWTGKVLGVVKRFSRQFTISAKEVFERESNYREDSDSDCVYCEVKDTTMWWMENLYDGEVTDVDRLTRKLHLMESYHNGTVATGVLKTYLTTGENAISEAAADVLLNAIDSDSNGRIDCRMFAHVIHRLADGDDEDED